MNSCAWAARATALDRLVRELGAAERDVLADGRGEEEGILRDDADLAPKGVERDVAHVGTVDGDAAGRCVVEARDERRERRLARAGVPDQRDRRPGGYVEVDAVQHRPAGRVLERELVEPDVAGTGGKRPGSGTIGDLLGLVDDLEDALAGRGRALRLADPHAECAQRDDEQREVEVEGDEAARRQRVIGHHPRTDEQHRRLREQRHDRDQRDVRRALPVRPQRLLEHELRAVAELLLLGRLLRERLDDVDADDVLLRHRRDVGEALLHVAQRRMCDVAVAVGERDEQRSGRERDERELPLDEEEDDRHRQHGEHVLEEEDQPVAEEEADALEVDGGPAHELPGLVPVVEAERQAHEMGVEAAAHVHLDVERLAARDDAATEHAARTGEAQPEDRQDVDPQRVRVVVEERVVDHVAAGHPDQRDRRRLRADGEEDRDDDSEPVRTEESEQPEEGRAIRNSAHFGRVPPRLCGAEAAEQRFARGGPERVHGREQRLASEPLRMLVEENRLAAGLGHQRRRCADGELAGVRTVGADPVRVELGDPVAARGELVVERARAEQATAAARHAERRARRGS